MHRSEDVEVLIFFSWRCSFLIYDSMIVWLLPRNLSPCLSPASYLAMTCGRCLHDGAAAGFADAAALAGFTAWVLDWLWLDDGRNAGGGGKHFAMSC